MPKIRNIFLTMLGDFAGLVLSWYVMYYLKYEAQWFEPPVGSSEPVQIFLPSLVIAAYWVVLFSFFGLYRNLFLMSRLDEVIKVAKFTIIGVLILFFLLFIESLNWTADNIKYAKTYVTTYSLVVFLTVAANRVVIRTIQKQLASRGFGLHKAVIVGTGESALNVQENLTRNRVSGMEVHGFVNMNGKLGEPKVEAGRVVGSLSNLKQIVSDNNIEDVIVALEDDQVNLVMDVINKVDMPNVKLMILPNFHQQIMGLNQTNQIFGLPLIEVMPDPMPTWEKVSKQMMDTLLSLIIVAATLPLSIILFMAVRLTSSGPAIFKQKRVGQYGREFTMYKFRTMYQDAEKRSGPVWATENDPRITPLGYWLRKLRLDEIPQFMNVIKGEMSLVGPRPERRHFVDQFKKEIPLYTRRLSVKPGITGWAQVKWKYDASLDDVKEKTKYDLFYVENMSLRMDFKILVSTIVTVIKGKGQ